MARPRHRLEFCRGSCGGGGLVLGFLLLLAAPAFAPPARADSPREAAVLLARAGQTGAAIAALRSQLTRGTNDPLVAMDLAVLLQQANRPAEATAVYERANPSDPPSYALLAVVRAYRDQKQFMRAATLARQGFKRFPDETVWPILLALILADSGDGDQALAVLAGPAAQRAPAIERLLAQGYAARQANRPFEALRFYADAAWRDPSNAEARDATAAILRGERAPFAAERFSPEPPPLPLRADMAAAELRWGTQVTAPGPAQRFAETDRALADLDRVMAAAGDNAALATRARFDRVVALRDRVRMREAVAEAEALRAQGLTLPPYVRHALADALLHLRQPEAARKEYDAVIADDPSNVDARVSRFYAIMEMGDVRAAYADADAQLAARQPWRRYTDDPTPYPRDEYLDALLLAASARISGEQPAEAWSRIAPVLDAAPANVQVRLTAGEAMQAQTWPRAAETERRIALGMAPTLLDAQIAVADSALVRHRYAEARERIAALAGLYPENLQVQRLQRELAAQTGWKFEARIDAANEQGGGTFGNNGNELTASSRIVSPLIDDTYRLFAGYDYANAHPPEGFVARQRAGLGLEITLPDLSGSIGLHQDFGTLDRTGGDASVDWMPSDQFQLAAGISHISIDTPLRALLYGITADSYNAKATYSWSEARSASLGAAFLPFTDGNRRYVLNSHFEQALIVEPRFRLIGNADLYASNNSRADAPYYNPAEDASAAIGMRIENTLWQRYDNSLVQALALDGGWYGERGYAGGPIGSVAYEHRWRFDPWNEFRYGVSIGRRMYDGDPSRVVGAFFEWSHRL